MGQEKGWGLTHSKGPQVGLEPWAAAARTKPLYVMWKSNSGVVVSAETTEKSNCKTESWNRRIVTLQFIRK